jgi:hypothetical protein
MNREDKRNEFEPTSTFLRLFEKPELSLYQNELEKKLVWDFRDHAN